jgi:hypothetical protein
MRPFQTAIGAMAVGSALLGLTALLHEDSPIARLVAERSAERQSTRLPAVLHSSEIRETPIIAKASPRDLRPSARPEGVADDVPTFWDQPVVRSDKDAGHFWNASQSMPQSDRGPTIQLSPLFTNMNSLDANNSMPLVTRTYRPASMSAASLERLVRPLLTARGETIATNTESPRPNDATAAADQARMTADAESTNRPGLLVVSDRPEAIGRIDALCHDLDSMSPRVAIDLTVVSVLPNTGRQLPWDQWRNTFGIVEADLPTVLNQIRGLGQVTVRARSQLQGISGTWTELECSAQSINPKGERPDSASSAGQEPANAMSASAAAPSTITTLRIRPSTQSEGTIRIEVRAQSSHLEDHAPTERSQLVTVRFNTDVMLHEGTTGVINLFVDEALNTGTAAASVIDPAATLVIPGGPSIPLAKIIPQPGPREQTLLLLMPRIAGPPRTSGKIAGAKARTPT